MLQLAVFLGNPGGDYARSRHNAGRLLAEALPFFSSLNWREKFKGRYAVLDRKDLAAFAGSTETGASGGAGAAGAGPSASAAGSPETAAVFPPNACGAGDKVYFLLPETFMNLSGDSVRPAAAFFKIPPEELLVIHDELELPLGTVSLKFAGGLGGHNGLRSVKAALGTAAFWRLRIGIGRPGDRRPGEGGPPGSGGGVVDWVLSDFTSAEEPALDRTLPVCAAVLIRALLRGPESLLPEWYKKRAVEDV
jgi:PTH1 family peptidyl-tRNA hydrolase